MADILPGLVGYVAGKADTIITKVVKDISHKISIGWNLKKKDGLLEKLGYEFQKLGVLVEGASKTSTSNKMLLLWLNKIECVADEADDLLDGWSYDDFARQAQIRKNHNPKKRKLKNIINTGVSFAKKAKKNIVLGCSSPRSRKEYDPEKFSVLRIAAATKVEALLEKINLLYEEAQKLRIEPVKVAEGETYEGPESAAIRQRQEQRLKDQRLYVEKQFVCGRDTDVQFIVQLLTQTSNSQQKLNVVGIVGMAGLGKTTLSHVIKDSKVVKENLFDEVIFVVVSHDCGSIDDIMKKVADEVRIQKGKSLDLSKNSNREVITALLGGTRRCLLILDDVWSTLSWDQLSKELVQIGGGRGTTILVTSREGQVVQNMSTDGELHIYTLKGLGVTDSWDLLFKNKITGDNNEVEGEKKEIAERMINKCEGNPLAITVLGSLLRKYNNNVAKWREFEKSDEWAKNDGTNYEANVLSSLQLSFTYLRNKYLKSCFLYCGVFGEDEEIYKEKLIRLWMAQGILPDREHVEMEAIGEEYFDELLDSSLFHEPVFHYGVLISVKMHDLVWNLVRTVSKSHNAEEASSSSGGGSHHKFSRSLLNFWVSDLSQDLQPYHQKLRVFSFKMYVNDDSVVRVNKKWDSLVQLRHLRFLNITVDLTGVEKSRASSKVIKRIYFPIAKLYHLQTLTIRGSIKEEDMPHLPEDFCNLVNLRHFQMDLFPKNSSIGIIEGFGNLTNLQTLPRIDLSKGWGGKASELGNLSKLSGTLDISHINNEEEARSINLGAKSCLEALHVRHTWDNEVLEALKPVDSLNALKIEFFKGTSLPTWLTSRGFSLSKLTKLSLVWCQQATGELNMGNFPRLRYLKLIECQELTMVFPEKGFECCQLLEVLVIKSCSKVDSIPDLSPLTKLRTLFFHNNGIKPNSTSKLHGLDGLQCSKVKTHAFLLPTTTITQDSPICKSLNALDIDGDPDVVNTIPDQLQHFVALSFLRLSGYTEQKGLHDDLIENMKSLEAIYLENMPKLECLPSETTRRRFTNLRTIAILACHPLLQGYHNKEDVASEEESGRRTTTICFSENSKTHPDEICLRQYLYTSPYIDIRAEWDKEFREDQDVICRIRDGN